MLRQSLRLIYLLFFLSANSNATEHILVFAASSLSLPLSEIAQEFEQKHQQKITLSYGASSALARQLIYGGSADIYISANSKWMDYVSQQGIINQQSAWLSNQLVLIADKNQPIANFQIQNITHILKKNRLSIANPTHVPLGIYTKQSLEYLNLWHSLSQKLAYANNSRATLALVERGETPFGIVYQTDAKSSSQVKVLYHFPPSSHSPIVYTKALIKNANTKAIDFYQYLTRDNARKILLKYGFTFIKPEQH